MDGKQWIYFAPRSNEKSRENFAATLATGYPIDTVKPFLNDQDAVVLGNRKLLYIWGNAPGKKDSWAKMEVGDLVAFYDRGVLVYAGKCILKKHSPDIALSLWGTIPKKEFTWEYVYFLDELEPIHIPIETVHTLGDYEDGMIVQGFMPINAQGYESIIEQYGSVQAFLTTYATGINSRDVAALDDIAEREQISAEDAVAIDRIMGSKDLDEVLFQWQQKHSNLKPEVIERRVAGIKRNTTLVRMMKEKFGNKCQVCGFTFKKKNGEYYSEVAHIEPLNTRRAGVDSPANMLVMCPNHHKMHDLGDLKILSVTEYEIEGERGSLREPMFSVTEAL